MVEVHRVGQTASLHLREPHGDWQWQDGSLEQTPVGHVCGHTRGKAGGGEVGRGRGSSRQSAEEGVDNERALPLGCTRTREQPLMQRCVVGDCSTRTHPEGALGLV